jgi:hypothetical protein
MLLLLPAQRGHLCCLSVKLADQVVPLRFMRSSSDGRRLWKAWPELLRDATDSG